MVIAAKAKGIIPPIRRKAKVMGSSMLTPATKISSLDATRIRVTKAPKSARETSAADPMAKPFPIAAVVFPAASRASVF